MSLIWCPSCPIWLGSEQLAWDPNYFSLCIITVYAAASNNRNFRKGGAPRANTQEITCVRPSVSGYCVADSTKQVEVEPAHRRYAGRLVSARA